MTIRSELIASIEQALRADRWNDVLTTVPYCRQLGLTLEKSGGRVISRMPHGPAVAGLGVVHGAAVGSLLQSAGLMEVLAHAALGYAPRLVSFTVQYVRTGRPADTFARAQIAHQGRRMVSVRAEAWQETAELPIAVSLASYVVD